VSKRESGPSLPQAYGQAQTQAQSAFENQMARNQSAATTFANLGQGIGAMAQAYSKAVLARWQRARPYRGQVSAT
jgi:hypothetical protein